MSRKILGIDIREDEISAVLVENSVTESTIQDCIHIPLEKDPDDNKDFHQALETLVQSIDMTNTVTIVSLPAEDVSFRNVHLPFKDRKKIKQILPLELESNLPFSVSALELDFQILSLDEDGTGALVMAAGLEKEKLDAYKDALAEIDIDPQAIVVGGFQTAGCINNFPDIPAHALFVDVDRRKVSVFTIVSGQIRLVRTFAVNVRSKNPGRILCNKIRQTLAASEEILGADYIPSAVYITGAGLEDYAYDIDIEEILETPVKKLNLAENSIVSLTGAPDENWHPDTMNNALALCVSEILGISGFNFSKRMFAVKKFWITHKKDIIKSGLMVSIVIILAMVNLFYDYHTMGKQIKSLDAQISAIFSSTFPNKKVSRDPLLQMQGEIKRARESVTVAEEKERTAKTIDILYDISAMLPEKLDVEIKNFVIGPDNVQIAGNTDTFNAVDEMKNRLEKGPHFKQVTISSSKKDNKENRINFKLKIDL